MVCFLRDLRLIKLEYHNGQFQPVQWQRAHVMLSAWLGIFFFLGMCHPMPAAAAAWAPDPLTNPDCLLILITLSSSCHWIHYSLQFSQCRPFLFLFVVVCESICLLLFFKRQCLAMHWVVMGHFLLRWQSLTRKHWNHGVDLMIHSAVISYWGSLQHHPQSHRVFTNLCTLLVRVFGDLGKRLILIQNHL